jgi:hypothetical protein
MIGGWSGFFIGERLSRALFEKAPPDHHQSQLSINVPLASTWPVLIDIKEQRGTAAGGMAVPVFGMEYRF